MRYVYTTLFFYGISLASTSLAVLGVTTLTLVALWLGGDE